jgi:hypothetical protein
LRIFEQPVKDADRDFGSEGPVQRYDSGNDCPQAVESQVHLLVFQANFGARNEVQEIFLDAKISNRADRFSGGVQGDLVVVTATARAGHELLLSSARSSKPLARQSEITSLIVAGTS